MKRFLKDQGGITLIEILISIVVLGIIMAMNTQLLQDMIRGSARQNAIVTTQFETTLGLEIMRTDIGTAGLGLADDISGILYSEAVSTSTTAFQYNDATINVPRALVHSNDGSTGAPAADNYIVNSDYLVIKSTAVGESMAARKWTYITGTNALVWGGGTPDSNLDMAAGDHMIVIRPRSNPGDMAVLVTKATSPFFDVAYTTAAYTAPFVSSVAGERLMAYGVDDSTLRMPFNRADYYVRRDSNSQNCAPGTGTLIKATVNHGDGKLTQMPLITCVANMQITFRFDTDGDGTPDTTRNTLTDVTGTALTALQIKQQVKEVRVYLLAHEGPRDNGYKHETQVINVGDPTDGLGRNVDLSSVVGANWRNYRWKTYTFFVKPRSLY